MDLYTGIKGLIHYTHNFHACTIEFSCINSLRPGDAYVHWWAGSPLVKAMTCCLLAPSHHLYQNQTFLKCSNRKLSILIWINIKRFSWTMSAHEAHTAGVLHLEIIETLWNITACIHGVTQANHCVCYTVSYWPEQHNNADISKGQIRVRYVATVHK